MLILKKTKLGETDLIITGFSEEGSQIRAVAKGARRPGSKLSVPLELYSVTRVLLYEGKGLGIIREVSLVNRNEECRSDIIHSAGAAVIVELIEQISSEGNTEARLFPLACEALRCLGDTPEDGVFLIAAAAALKIAAQVGYRPSIHECVLCGALTKTSQEFSSANHHLNFSFDDGGVVCSNCCNSSEEHRYPNISAQVVLWAQTLILSRFSEIKAFTNAEYRALGGSMLSFSRDWICFHVVKRLKSLDILLSFV